MAPDPNAMEIEGPSQRGRMGRGAIPVIAEVELEPEENEHWEVEMKDAAEAGQCHFRN